MLFKKDDLLFLSTADFWKQAGISETITNRKFSETFGSESFCIPNRDEAIKYLSNIMDIAQEKMVQNMQYMNPKELIVELYKVFDKCFHIYMQEKEVRQTLSKNNIIQEELVDVLAQNRNIATNIIEATNIWLENTVLFQENINKKYKCHKKNIDPLLFVDLYIYGSVSKALSLLNLSKKYGKKALYYGIKVEPTRSNSLDIIREHPVIYYNPLIVGNQNVFKIPVEEYQNARESDFGKGFYKEYKVDFLLSLRMFKTFQEKYLKKGKIACISLKKEKFMEAIDYFTNGKIQSNSFFDAFVITKEKMHKQLCGNNPIIWKSGVNKYRHELRPFLCLDDDTVFISHEALTQSINIWFSLFANGGRAYSNYNDKFTEAEELRERALSKQLVLMIREILQRNYTAAFDDINVDYSRIFGVKEKNYGDFDLVFLTEKTNDLYLIESKFFSDSLNNSGIINDYEKLFGEKGYYYHCRERINLVLKEPEKIHSFLEISGKIKAHFIFLSSKPLEIELMDKDNVITFLCLNNFEKYITGKIISEDGLQKIENYHII